MMKEKHKLVYLISSLRTGGAPLGMVRLLSGLDPDEFEITVVGIDGGSCDALDLLPDYVNAFDLGVNKKYNLHKITPLWKYIESIDILVCSLFHAKVLGSVVGKLCHVPTILVWQHSIEYKSDMRKKAAEVVYKRVDGVLADSVAVREMIIAEFDIDPNKVRYVPIAGIDTDAFKPSRLGSSNGKRKVGTVGRLIPAKGYQDFIRCAARITEAEFHIAGYGPDEEKLKQLNQEIEAGVTFHGKIPNNEIPRFLNSLDVYFQPSYREGLGMTVVEAMACGLPVVASSVGGITNSVTKETGYLHDAGDLDGYCQSIRHLLENDKKRGKLGRNARQRVIKNYSQDTMVESFLKSINN